MKYHFSVIRFVPDSFRGEFVNVGVIVGNEESGEWQVRQIDNPERARRFDRENRLTAVWSYLDDIGGAVDAALNGGEESPFEPTVEWLRGEWHRHRNVVQLSEPSVVAADDVHEATSLVFNTFILDPEKKGRRTRTAAVSALRHAYEASGVASHGYVHEHVRVDLGRQSLPLDFAIANGNLAQLSHAWSFQTQNAGATVQRIKAWSWALRDMRERGGQLTIRDSHQTFTLDAKTPVGVLYVEPDSDDGRAARDESLEVFDHLEVLALPTDRAIQIASTAAEILGVSSSSERELLRVQATKQLGITDGKD